MVQVKISQDATWQVESFLAVQRTSAKVAEMIWKYNCLINGKELSHEKIWENILSLSSMLVG